MAFFSSPAKPWLIHQLSVRNQQPKRHVQPETERLEKEERAHPLQGLPSDLTAEVDEAVKEIQEEVEARRRKGSVEVRMPKGEDMKAAVEDKLGKKLS